MLDGAEAADEELVSCIVEDFEAAGLELAKDELELAGLEEDELVVEVAVDDEDVTPPEVVLDTIGLADEELEDCVAEELEVTELGLAGLELAKLELDNELEPPAELAPLMFIFEFDALLEPPEALTLEVPDDVLDTAVVEADDESADVVAKGLEGVSVLALEAELKLGLDNELELAARLVLEAVDEMLSPAAVEEVDVVTEEERLLDANPEDETELLKVDAVLALEVGLDEALGVATTLVLVDAVDEGLVAATVAELDDITEVVVEPTLVEVAVVDEELTPDAPVIPLEESTEVLDEPARLGDVGVLEADEFVELEVEGEPTLVEVVRPLGTRLELEGTLAVAEVVLEDDAKFCEGELDVTEETSADVLVLNDVV